MPNEPKVLRTPRNLEQPSRGYQHLRAEDSSTQHNGDNFNNIYLNDSAMDRSADMLPTTSTEKNVTFDAPAKYQYFHGREDVLEQMQCWLSPSLGASCQLSSCLIHAMGGMGKTQIALEYAHRNRHLYEYVFWLSAENKTELDIEYGKIARKLKMKNVEGMSDGRRFELVREWFDTTDHTWLLILDNVDAWEDVKRFWPTNDSGAIIMTSQISGLVQVGPVRENVSPRALDQEEGSELFLDLAKYDDPSDQNRKIARKISGIVGGLPIAIAHLAGYIYENEIEPEELEQKLQTREAYSIWSSGQPWSTKQYERSLNMVWEIALDELEPEARNLLDVLSLLSPDSVQEAMLKHHFDPSKSLKLESVRSSLIRRHLVQRKVDTEPYLSLHRSLQFNLRSTLAKNPAKMKSIFDQAVGLVRQAIPRQSRIMTPVNHHWQACETYQPHVNSLQQFFQRTKIANQHLEGSSEFGNLLSDVANYFWERNFLDEGLDAAGLAVNILDSSERPNPKERAQARSLLGSINLETGLSGREIGVKTLLEALDIRKQSIETPPPGGTREEQLLYANAWNDFGVGLLEFAEYAKAEKYLEHALEIKKRSTTKDDEPMEFAEAYMNLAMVRSSQNRNDAAKQLLGEAVALSEKANGRHSACTQNFMFYWATILFIAGDYVEAKKKHKSILEERKEIFGTYSPRTRHSYYALGATYQKLKSFEKSETMYRESLEKLDEFPYPDEYIARSSYGLSRLLREQGRLGEAIEHEVKARKIRDFLLPQYKEQFEQADVDETASFDYMVSYKAGRTTMQNSPIKPFDIEETGIDQSIANFGKYDSQLRNLEAQDEA